MELLLGRAIEDKFRVTQEFGEDKSDYSKYGLIHHNGRDLAAPLGTKVYATHDGQAWVYIDAGYGFTVELWAPAVDGRKYKTISAHLSRILVPHGARVREGQLIGLVGSTGNSTGPHLHFGVKIYANGAKNPGYRDWVDPRGFLSADALFG